MVGVLAGTGISALTYGAISLYANTVSYQATKHYIIRYASKYGREVAENYIKERLRVYSEPKHNSLGRIGIRLAVKNYRDGHFDPIIERKEHKHFKRLIEEGVCP